MRPIVKFAGVGALAGASLLAFGVSADAKIMPAAAHPHAYAPHGVYRHEGADRSLERRYRRNLAGYLAGGGLGIAAANAADGYPAGYEGPQPPVEAGYAYPAPIGAEAPAYANDGVERVVLYQNVTKDYTVPVRSYRTVQKTHYVPVVSYRAVTSEYQVPVTTYETVQRTEQVPMVYRVVHHHGCGCSLDH